MKNRKSESGQTMLEFCLVGLFGTGILCAALMITIRFLLTVALDDTIESYLTCRTYQGFSKSQCESKLTEKLTTMKFQVQSISEHSQFLARKTETKMRSIESKIVHVTVQRSVFAEQTRSRAIELPDELESIYKR